MLLVVDAQLIAGRGGVSGGGLQLVGKLAEAKGQQQRQALDVGFGDLHCCALLGEQDAVVLQRCGADLA